MSKNPVKKSKAVKSPINDIKDIPTYQPEDKVKPQGEIESQKKKKLTKKRITAKQIAFDALREQGVPDDVIRKKLGLSRTYGWNLGKREKKDWYKEFESLAPGAIKSIGNLSKGKKVGDLEDVKGSDVISACKEVLDRIVPKQQASDVPTNTFIQINHNMFAPSESNPTIIDIPKDK